MGYSSSEVPSSVDPVASAANAKLIGDQWADYTKRFMPQESKLINQMGTNGIQTSLLPESINKTKTIVKAITDSSAGQQNRDMERYGIGLNDMQDKALSTSRDLVKGTVTDNSVNQTRQYDQDMRNSVVSGGLGNASALVKGKI
jgi:hypothetical protein